MALQLREQPFFFLRYHVVFEGDFHGAFPTSDHEIAQHEVVHVTPRGDFPDLRLQSGQIAIRRADFADQRDDFLFSGFVAIPARAVLFPEKPGWLVTEYALAHLNLSSFGRPVVVGRGDV